jgi:hypothetical protein
MRINVVKVVMGLFLAAVFCMAGCGSGGDGGGGDGGGGGGGGAAAVPTAPITGRTLSITTTAATPPAGAIIQLPQTATMTFSSPTTWSTTVSGITASGTYTYVTTSTTSASYHFVQTSPNSASGDLTFTATSINSGTFTGTMSSAGLAAFPVSGTFSL